MRHHKDHKSMLVEYVGSLSDGDLCYLGSKLSERYGDDLAEALNFMSARPVVDNILGNAAGYDELWALCDLIRDLVTQQCRRRKLNNY